MLFGFRGSVGAVMKVVESKLCEDGSQNVLLVKFIEPPYTEWYVRWCERSEFLIYEKFLLLD